MKLEDLNKTLIRYVIAHKETGELFQNGRMFDQTGHAKNAWQQQYKYGKLPNWMTSPRFDDQFAYEIVKLEYTRIVEEIK